MTALVVPVVEGEGIRLRPFATADVGLIVDAGRDSLIPLITTVVAHGNEADGQAFIERQHQRAVKGEGWSFAVADFDTDSAVGQIGLWRRDLENGIASAGYWIGPGHRRRGYARRALRLLSSWSATVAEVSRLELYIEPWNEASWRAAESAGYQREGLLRRWQKIAGEPRDMYMYARLT